MTIQELLEAIGFPAMCETAGDQIEYVAPEVKATGNPARVTITVSIFPGKGDALILKGKVVLTMPKNPRDTTDGWESTLYRGDDGNLVLEDPRQPRLMKGA